MFFCFREEERRGEREKRERKKERERERKRKRKKGEFFFPSKDSFFFFFFLSGKKKEKNNSLSHRQPQLVEAEPHQVHLQLPLRGAQPSHDDSPARGDLLVPRVDEVGERLEGVRRGESGVPPRGGELDRRVDQDRVYELIDAHVLEHASLVIVRPVGAVGFVEFFRGRAGSDCVRERSHRKELEVDAGAHVGADAVGEDVADGENLEEGEKEREEREREREREGDERKTLERN